MELSACRSAARRMCFIIGADIIPRSSMRAVALLSRFCAPLAQARLWRGSHLAGALPIDALLPATAPMPIICTAPMMRWQAAHSH